MDDIKLYSSIPNTGSLAHAADEPNLADQNLVIALLTAAVAYQAILCLLNTLAINTSAAIVGLSEGLIIAWYHYHRAIRGRLLLLCGTV
jgi:hypothetical protein